MSFIARPTGWPDAVPPAGVIGWERWAVVFLFDCCPPDFRRHPVLVRFPAVLAWFARHFVEGQQRVFEQALQELRVNLRDVVASTVVEQAVEAWQSEAAALTRTVRAVRLIEEALRAQPP